MPKEGTLAVNFYVFSPHIAPARCGWRKTRARSEGGANQNGTGGERTFCLVFCGFMIGSTEDSMPEKETFRSAAAALETGPKPAGGIYPQTPVSLIF